MTTLRLYRNNLTDRQRLMFNIISSAIRDEPYGSAFTKMEYYRELCFMEGVYGVRCPTIEHQLKFYSTYDEHLFSLYLSF